MASAGVSKKLRAILNVMLATGPEGKISKRWLFRASSSRLCRKFVSAQKPSVSDHGEYVQIAFGEEVFLWPAIAPIEGAMQILSEILIPAHPHQYVYGPTQIFSDDVVLDIGACEGSFAALVTRRCRRVIVVEPSRTMCCLIEELFKVRRQTGPIVMNCLLGEEPSKAYFAENALNPGASHITCEPVHGAYEVPVLTLDQLVEMVGIRPTFIKCDAEGAAAQIFSGGRKFLQEFRPRLAVASYHTDSEYLRLYNLLTSIGYNVMGKGLHFKHDKLRIKMLHAW